MSLKHFLKGFGLFAILITLAPLVAVDYWWIRIFDFPHVQLTFLTALAIVVYFIKFDFKNEGDYAFIMVLLACFIFQFVKFFPYTAFSKEELLNASKDTKRTLSILTANVHQDNEDTEKVLNSIKKSDADVMVFTEANERWRNAIYETISKDYNYKFEYPMDNTYGMLLYSKLQLKDTELKFLVEEDIPSIHTKLITKFGDTINLHAIHPTPPMPQHNPRSTDRDAEMMMVAKDVMDTKFPTIVLGDFNDVPWSNTNQLFKTISKTLDPRIGRGLFSTYNAKKFLLRWPLDHIYCTKEFRLVSLKTYNETSSDHFPVYAKLSLEPEKADEQKPDEVSQHDLERANNQIEKFKSQ
ncbi:endonuclease/exonuclease/phosphatase family protein [Winogradskyella luteola]|uniref:Endonuclease/exonuclease/phosphatase family protein n=1 Tax=Winogradskyella luteola TaxID=2828330 RepID=A0A9X1FB36_9FLAO|nr:endonuclease/exonuclease/phosphatase family protein [Winogradskyella luteola]MBV7270585.1 endonuclease/exonuclease/phosphatase family protein [Winogradskyella luteola]